MLPSACSTSSSCAAIPGPPLTVALHAPCDLTITAVTDSGACQQLGGPPSAPSFEGTGGGTCDIAVTLSNGFHTTVSVQFTKGTGACDFDLTPSTDTIYIDAGILECGATAPADASGG